MCLHGDRACGLRVTAVVVVGRSPRFVQLCMDMDFQFLLQDAKVVYRGVEFGLAIFSTM